MEFDHIGVAVEDAEAVASLYETLFDTPVVHEEEYVGGERLWIQFLDMDGTGYLELLEPLEDGPVAEMVTDTPGALHHVGLRTEDINGALETCRKHGIELLDEEPRPGAWGHEVAFLHPKSTAGVLMELVG